MNQKVPRLSKLPFLVGDLLLLATAGLVAVYGPSLGVWQFAVVAGAVALGAWLLAWPYVLEHRAAAKLAEAGALEAVTAKIQELETVAASIQSASREWQHLQQSSTQSLTAAQHIAEQITAEARSFGEVLSKLHESEKNHMRLEVEKLRRAEGDWLGVTVRMLDHVHALHQAGVRSGQRQLIDQLNRFQAACLDTARRLGVAPLLAETGAPFDAQAHQTLDGQKPAEGAVITAVLAPGFSFQGQVIRLPVVAAGGPAATGVPEATPAKAGEESAPAATQPEEAAVPPARTGSESAQLSFDVVR